MSVLAQAHSIGADLIALRRRLHALPEVGLHLPMTQQLVLDELQGLGLEVSTGRELSSVTAVLRGSGNGNGPVVLLRGDMDALPVTEDANVSFAPAEDSPHHGAMHACGHDLHMAGLIGAARLLSGRREELTGDVVFMFQPGEECCDGASLMIREGVLDATGRRAEAAYGIHVFSGYFPTGLFTARPGPLMASSARLHVRVLGYGAHASAPHKGRDPIPAAAEMVLALQAMVTRRFDVFDPVVITVGSFHAGTESNVIPDDAIFDATVRTFSQATADRVAYESVQLCEQIGAAHTLQVEAEFLRGYPVTKNDDAEYAFAADTARELFGADRFAEMVNPLTGSEDFSRVLAEIPGAFVFIGAGTLALGQAPSNHSPHVTFDDSLLPDIAAYLTELAVRRMAR